jgi:hypothetical protein
MKKVILALGVIGVAALSTACQPHYMADPYWGPAYQSPVMRTDVTVPGYVDRFGRVVAIDNPGLDRSWYGWNTRYDAPIFR